MKKKLVFIGIALLLVALTGLLVVKMMYKKAERNVATEKAITITPVDIVLAFVTNESRANAVYLNKVIEVNGVVGNIEQEQDQTILTIITNKNLPSINAVFSTSVNINKGDSIVFKGICTGYLSSLLVNDCILLSSKKVVESIINNPQKDTLPKAITTIKKDSTPVIEVFKTQKAQISFDAGGGIEDIKATNNRVEASLDIKGNLNFRLALLQFKFDDVLMKQLFNEEYAESDKYPTASFTGKINNPKAIDLNKDGTYNPDISGQLTLHGQTKTIQTKAQITIKNQKIMATSSLKVILKDFGVKSGPADEAIIKIIANF